MRRSTHCDRCPPSLIFSDHVLAFCDPSSSNDPQQEQQQQYQNIIHLFMACREGSTSQTLVCSVSATVDRSPPQTPISISTSIPDRNATNSHNNHHYHSLLVSPSLSIFPDRVCWRILLTRNYSAPSNTDAWITDLLCTLWTVIIIQHIVVFM